MNLARNLFCFKRNKRQEQNLLKMLSKVQEFRRTFGYSAEIRLFDMFATVSLDNIEDIEMCMQIQPTRIENDRVVKNGEMYTYCDYEINIMDVLTELIETKRQFPNTDFNTIWETVNTLFAELTSNNSDDDNEKSKIEYESDYNERPEILVPEK